MKISIAASMLILAAGAVLGWHDWQRIAAFQATRARLSAEAAESGFSSDPTHSAKRERPARAAVAKLSAAEVIRLAMELEQLNTGVPNYPATSALQLQILDSLTAWDTAGLKAFLVEIATNPELTPGTRMTLGFSCATVLTYDHPQAALEIFTNSPELFNERDRDMNLVCTALASWARNDPSAAVEWLRNNPQPWSNYFESGILSAAAEQDPQHAFRLIAELDLKSSNQAIWSIVESAKTLEQKASALAGMREYLATIQDEEVREQVAESSISGLARNMEREGFESATRWISSMKLNPREFDHFIDSMNFPTTNGETGRWIEWLRQSPPGQASDSRIQHLIYDWTCSDYQAAMQWAVSQPQGKDRAQVLKTIHGNWPKEDPAGKEAFAKEHGIQ